MHGLELLERRSDAQGSGHIGLCHRAPNLVQTLGQTWKAQMAVRVDQHR
jgi:hypothetical protein